MHSESVPQPSMRSNSCGSIESLLRSRSRNLAASFMQSWQTSVVVDVVATVAAVDVDVKAGCWASVSSQRCPIIVAPKIHHIIMSCHDSNMRSLKIDMQVCLSKMPATKDYQTRAKLLTELNGIL